ncbi:hypothetical protein GIB67_017677 [Kingdonia uniflora]|uniref:Helicase C-terminal domain-containing protein n=1 Tax=Kingdonia uniflora TaxID=39325 RepID=A0A7J7NAH7_9MAGN|nr:hypothetical protein GIB67_017677 [Kingdonia uniflora]
MDIVINTSGCLSPTRKAFGGIIRLKNGISILAFNGLANHLSSIGEIALYVVCEGIKAATSLGIKRYEDFQEGSAPIFLLTSQVAGLSLTLTKADRIIVVDPAWNPRETNSVAYGLSKLRTTEDYEDVLYADFSDDMKNMVQSDARGKIFFRVKMTRKMYKKIEKEYFKLDHCWEELRHHGKWMLEFEKKKGKAKVSNECPNPENGNPTTPITNLDENETVDGNEGSAQRPNGRKAEKELRKRRGKEKESPLDSKFTKVLQEFIEGKKNDRDRRFAMDQFQEDERIMLQDTDGMDEMTKKNYNSKKAEILARNKSK